MTMPEIPNHDYYLEYGPTSHAEEPIVDLEDILRMEIENASLDLREIVRSIGTRKANSFEIDVLEPALSQLLELALAERSQP
jgi:hypothetical protein